MFFLGRFNNMIFSHNFQSIWIWQFDSFWWNSSQAFYQFDSTKTTHPKCAKGLNEICYSTWFLLNYFSRKPEVISGQTLRSESRRSAIHGIQWVWIIGVVGSADPFELVLSLCSSYLRSAWLPINFTNASRSKVRHLTGPFAVQVAVLKI